MKKYILIFSAVALLMPFLALAQTDNAAESNEITLEDLEVSDPGLLPTSNFYFFKEFVRGMRRAVTFNSVSRAELELKILNEKAAELKKVSENNTDSRGLERAVANYKDNAERLKARLEALKETSENPNIDKLLDKLADRTLKHEQLFEELKAKHEALKDKIEDVKENLESTMADAAERLDTAEKLKERFQKAVENQREENVKEIRAVGFLDQIEERVKDDEVRVKLSEAKDELIEKFDERVNKRLIAPSAIPQLLETLPITEAQKLRILEKVKEQTGSAEVKVQLENIEGRVTAGVKEEAGNKKEAAERAMKSAEEMVSDLRERINSGKYATVTEAIKMLLVRAENRMINAKTALEEGNYGEAFGQATSAASTAKNAISQLLRANVSDTGIVKKCGVNTFAVSNKCASGGFGNLYVQCYDSYEERPDGCRSSEEWQEYARKICANRCNVSGYIPSVKPVLVPAKPPVAITPAEPNTVCTKEYEPVCGVNNKTYGNTCEARVAGVAIKSKGACPTNLFPKTIIPELKMEIPSVTAVPAARKWSVAAKDGAFFPAEIKIRKGDTVVWTNFDSSPAWPASAFHPTHEVYPGFDARTALNQGQSYSFTFDKVGNWKYHNHLNPSSTGLVEVSE